MTRSTLETWNRMSSSTELRRACIPMAIVSGESGGNFGGSPTSRWESPEKHSASNVNSVTGLVVSPVETSTTLGRLGHSNARRVAEAEGQNRARVRRLGDLPAGDEKEPVQIELVRHLDRVVAGKGDGGGSLGVVRALEGDLHLIEQQGERGMSFVEARGHGRSLADGVDVGRPSAPLRFCFCGLCRAGAAHHAGGQNRARQCDGVAARGIHIQLLKQKIEKHRDAQ